MSDDPQEPDYIEGELADDAKPPAERSQLPAERRPAPVPANPLDHRPEDFGAALERRQANYLAFREHILAILMPGRDFGRIHVDKDCDRPRSCTFEEAPWHFSDITLFASGADKALSELSVVPRYPGLDDYRRQALRGVKFEEVIIACQIVDWHGNVLAEGMGAATLKECRGSLHNALSKAQKRARLEATRRLPTISSLFEDPNFVSAADRAAADAQRQRAAQRRAARDPVAPQERGRFATGRLLTALPFKIGKFDKGTRLTDIDEGLLKWILEKMADKPDLAQAVQHELGRRRLQEPEGGHPPAAPERPQETRSGAGGQRHAPAGDRRSADGQQGGGDYFDDGPSADDYFRR